MIRLSRTKRGRREKLRFFPGLKNLNEKMPHSINASAIKPIDNLVVTPAYNFAWPFLFEPFSPSMLPMYFSLLTELHLSLTRSDRIDRLVFVVVHTMAVKECVKSIDDCLVLILLSLLCRTQFHTFCSVCSGPCYPSLDSGVVCVK